MNFKAWLKANETVLGSDGMRDNQVTQTNQAVNQAADKILGDKSFAPFQSKVLNASGSPSGQRDQLIDFTTKGLSNIVPKPVATLAPPPTVAFQMGQKLGLNPNPIPKPKLMRKRMVK